MKLKRNGFRAERQRRQLNNIIDTEICILSRKINNFQNSYKEFEIFNFLIKFILIPKV